VTFSIVDKFQGIDYYALKLVFSQRIHLHRTWPRPAARLLFVAGLYLVAVYLLTLFCLGRNLHAMNVAGRTYVAFIGWAPPTYRLLGAGMLSMSCLLLWNAHERHDRAIRSLLWAVPLAFLGGCALVDPDLQSIPWFALALYVVSLTAAYAAIARKQAFR
jgi:hypothetical protein